MTALKFEPGCYLAFVLSKESRAKLIELCPPSFERTICHHVTIAFNLDENLFDKLIDVISRNPKVVATGYLSNGKNLECFAVSINNAHRSLINGQHYHVTHSLQSPAKPVDSNKLVMGTDPLQLIQVDLTGTLEMIKK
jgi:hypothetical protein